MSRYQQATRGTPVASNKPTPRPFSALGRISTPIRPTEKTHPDETGTRTKIPSPLPPEPRASGLRMAPAMIYIPPPIEPEEHSAEWEDEEKTPVDNRYRVIDGKVVDIGEALPSTPPPKNSPPLPSKEPPPTIPETPLAIWAKMSLPPTPVLNVTWVENRSTRIRNGISFFLLACFIVIMIAGATWAFLWNGRNHQQLIQHQREEQEKQDRYK